MRLIKIIPIALLFSISLGFSQSKSTTKDKSKEKAIKVEEVKKEIKEKVSDATKVDTSKIKLKPILTEVDTTVLQELDLKFKTLKKKAHASYYHQRFHGKRTASGKKFDNNGYTAAHKKLPFGTKVKVTNEANGKSVIVEITDRGPFSKVRDIDLTKKAFMEIANNKNSGVMIVTIEVVEEKK